MNTYTILEFSDNWGVGYFDGSGRWLSVSKHETEAEAKAACAIRNGSSYPPASPVHTTDTPTLRAFPSESSMGLSMRDYVAIQLLAALFAGRGPDRDFDSVPWSSSANSAFQAADAFMKQREVGL